MNDPHDASDRTTTDARPPIACDMSRAPDTLAERMAEYRRLFSGFLIGRDRAAGGVRFRFRAGEGVEDWVRELARREKDCCAFFDIKVTADDEEVRWDMSVIDDEMARRVLAAFYRLPDTLGGAARRRGLRRWCGRCAGRPRAGSS